MTVLSCAVDTMTVVSNHRNEGKESSLTYDQLFADPSHYDADLFCLSEPDLDFDQEYEAAYRVWQESILYLMQRNDITLVIWSFFCKVYRTVIYNYSYVSTASVRRCVENRF